MKRIVVRERDDLARLITAKGFSRVLSFDQIAFDLQDVSRVKQLAWENKLNTYAKRCGCSVGALVTLVMLGVTAFYVISNYATHSILSLFITMIFGFVLALLFGLAAKMLTLVLTTQQFRYSSRKILTSLYKQ